MSNILQLSPQLTTDIQVLLEKYADVFKEDISEPVKGYKVHILIQPNSMPIYRKYYNVPVHLRGKVQIELQKLEKQGVIVPTKYTNWTTPLVVVRKINKEIRLCLDLRSTLNEVADKVNYPLPKIEDILFILHGASYFTLIDLRSAYLQLELNDASQKL